MPDTVSSRLLAAVIALTPAAALGQADGSARAPADGTTVGSKPWRVDLTLETGWSQAIVGFDRAGTTRDGHPVSSAPGTPDTGNGAFQLYNLLNPVLTWRLTPEIDAIASVGVWFEWTRPESGRKLDFEPAYTYLQAAHSSLWTDARTGLLLTGTATLLVPASRADVSLNPRLPQPSLNATLSREFGPVTLAYGPTFTKYLPLHATRLRNPEDERTSPIRVEPLASYNTSWRLLNQLRATWRATPDVTANLRLRHYTDHTFGPSEVSALTSPQNPDPTAVRFQTGYLLDVAYRLDPRWSFALGYTNIGSDRPQGRAFRPPWYAPDGQFYADATASF